MTTIKMKAQFLNVLECVRIIAMETLIPRASGKKHSPVKPETKKPAELSWTSDLRNCKIINGVVLSH